MYFMIIFKIYATITINSTAITLDFFPVIPREIRANFDSALSRVLNEREFFCCSIKRTRRSSPRRRRERLSSSVESGSKS